MFQNGRSILKLIPSVDAWLTWLTAGLAMTVKLVLYVVCIVCLHKNVPYRYPLYSGILVFFYHSAGIFRKVKGTVSAYSR